MPKNLYLSFYIRLCTKKNKITNSSDFKEIVVTIKNTPSYDTCTLTCNCQSTWLHSLYRMYNLIMIRNWPQQIFQVFIAQACNSVFPVILGCIVPCIQLQSSPLLWCTLGCTLMLQHMLSCTSLQLPLTLSASFMLGHLLLQKTHICFSIAFNMYKQYSWL